MPRIPAFARPLASAINSPFRSFLTLHEGEALDSQGGKNRRPDYILPDIAVLLISATCIFTGLVSRRSIFSEAGSATAASRPRQAQPTEMRQRTQSHRMKLTAHR
ncbi:hypothetical protein BDR06DRAFT_959340 [Suillus hirtellus]|nr:hypothetical protein BDR06DRAFT_959340 [Suillus hirtellus]